VFPITLLKTPPPPVLINALASPESIILGVTPLSHNPIGFFRFWRRVRFPRSAPTFFKAFEAAHPSSLCVLSIRSAHFSFPGLPALGDRLFLGGDIPEGIRFHTKPPPRRSPPSPPVQCRAPFSGPFEGDSIPAPLLV